MRTQDGIASAIASAKLAGCGASVFDGLHAAVRGAWLSLVLWSAYAPAATQPAASKAAREVPGRWKHVRTPTTAFRNPVCLAPASNTLRHAVDVRRKRKLAAMVTRKGRVCNMCGICLKAAHCRRPLSASNTPSLIMSSSEIASRFPTFRTFS